MTRKLKLKNGEAVRIVLNGDRTVYLQKSSDGDTLSLLLPRDRDLERSSYVPYIFHTVAKED